MKIDLSTLLLVVVAIIPGLFAQRSRNLLVPRSFSAKGASEELAELVALGLATHGVIAFLIAGFLVEPWHKAVRLNDYSALQVDGILIDLADVACLSIKQTD